MKPRTSFSSGSVATTAGSEILAKKEGLVSQIASKFQRQVEPENPPEPVVLRKKSDSSTSVLKLSSSTELAHKSSGISRTESHQTRFHNARAMFERMGSADDLDNVGSTPAPTPKTSVTTGATRSSSVCGRPSLELNNKSYTHRASFNVPSTSGTNRSRSTSPFAGSRSSSQSSLKQNQQSVVVRSSSGNFVSSPTTPTSSISSYLNGSSITKPLNGHKAEPNGNDVDANDNTTSLVKARRISFQKAVGASEAMSSDTEGKPSITGPRPNIKELTNKQRNWFTSFERGRSPSTTESPAPSEVSETPKTKNSDVTKPQESAAATSVSDTESLVSGSSMPPDATPTPPANLNLPGDRRPLSALTSNSPDSIEDYIRNWRKSSPTATPTIPSVPTTSIT